MFSRMQHGKPLLVLLQSGMSEVQSTMQQQKEHPLQTLPLYRWRTESEDRFRLGVVY